MTVPNRTLAEARTPQRRTTLNSERVQVPADDVAVGAWDPAFRGEWECHRVGVLGHPIGRPRAGDRGAPLDAQPVERYELPRVRRKCRYERFRPLSGA
jgi:hypothetical protein